MPRALQEVHHVLVPGGVLLFFEHGLAPDDSVARWQRLLTPVQKCIGGGCHLDRPIRSLIERAELQIATEDYAAEYAPDTPRIVGWFMRGVGRKTGR